MKFWQACMFRRLGCFLLGPLLWAAPLAHAADGADKPYRFNLYTHSSAEESFWKTLKRGMDDACAQFKAECRLVLTRETGNLPMEVENMEAGIAQKIDGMAVPIVDDKVFDEPIRRALAAGIPVLAMNVDDTKGAAGNARLAFIGQDLFQSGYALMRGLYERMDHKRPQHVLLGLARLGESWAEQRIGGARKFLNEVMAANPQEKISFKVIESTADSATVGKRVCEYVAANPATTAYVDSGYWVVGAAACLRQAGIKPNQILMGGFDLVPAMLDEMKAGYVHVTVDQQPYLQGYLPIMQLYFIKKYGMSAWDVNTGKALVHPADVPAVSAFVAKGVR